MCPDWASVEVRAAQSAPVVLELRISEWWMRRSIMAAATMSSPKISPHAENGLLEEPRGFDAAFAAVAVASHDLG